MAKSVELAASTGKLLRAEADRYLAMFQQPAGDKLLAFWEGSFTR